MRAVDTSVLVRLAVRDDEQQVAAAEAYIAGGAWVSQLVLVEFTWVLASVYELGSAEISVAIEMLLSHERLSLEAPPVVAAALERYRGNTRVSFSDCLILEAARKAGHAPLGTFDRDLARLSGTERLGAPEVRRRAKPRGRSR